MTAQLANLWNRIALLLLSCDESAVSVVLQQKVSILLVRNKRSVRRVIATVNGRGRLKKRTEEFERVALGHLDELVRVATRSCGSRENAEDFVQETYMRAWKYWDRFEAGTNCRAWLYKILFNVIRQKRGGIDPRTIPLESESLGAVLPFTPPPTLSLPIVEAAFEKLPEDYRQALVLVAVEGFSYKETAEILEIPIGTVMSRLHRGREALRNIVDAGSGNRQDQGDAARHGRST